MRRWDSLATWHQPFRMQARLPSCRTSEQTGLEAIIVGARPRSIASVPRTTLRRPEVRRVGKEGVRHCRPRGRPSHYKKTNSKPECKTLFIGTSYADELVLSKW